MKFWSRPIARKVPQITFLFWVIKLLTTALGESNSDYLVYKYNPYIVVVTGFIAFLLILWMQFRTAHYEPWTYWLTVTMVAIFGTMAADTAHVALGVPYVVSTTVFAIVLAIVFVIWKRSEGTLSIHSVNTSRRELFYWLTVSAAFALGTAAGDMMAYTFNLGFFTAGIIFTIIFALPAIGYWLFRLNAIFAFWAAYIMTRPIGASFADWMGKPKAVGGLGWGDGPVAAVLVILIIVFVGYLKFTHSDVDRHRLNS